MPRSMEILFRPGHRTVLAAMSVAAAVTIVGCTAEVPDPPKGARSITISTPDGAELSAIELGSGPDVVVMSPGATTTKEDFYDLAIAFAGDGWRVLAYDAREVEDRPVDLRAAVAREKTEGMRTLVLVGGSLGASVSLGLAEELEADAVVSLSASASSFDALNGAESLRGMVPVLVLAARDDHPFAEDAQLIAQAAGQQARILDGDGHGTGLLVDHPEASMTIVRWVEKRSDVGFLVSKREQGGLGWWSWRGISPNPISVCSVSRSRATA